MRDIELLWIAFLLFVVLMGYTCSKAYAGEEYHPKIKPLQDQQYCFTKIIITTKGDTVTKEEKLKVINHVILISGRLFDVKTS